MWSGASLFGQANAHPRAGTGECGKSQVQRQTLRKAQRMAAAKGAAFINQDGGRGSSGPAVLTTGPGAKLPGTDDVAVGLAKNQVEHVFLPAMHRATQVIINKKFTILQGARRACAPEVAGKNTLT